MNIVRLNHSIMNIRNEEGLIYAIDLKFLLNKGHSIKNIDELQKKISAMTKKQLAAWLWRVQFPDRFKAFLAKLIKLRIKIHFEGT